MDFSEKDLNKIMETELFCDSSPETVREILAATGCYSMRFSDGETVLSPATAEKKAGVLLSGHGVISTPDPTKQMLLRFLEKGEVFGIANLFTDDPFVSLIQAHGEAKVFFLTEDAIRRLLESDHAFLYRYLGFLSGRIRYLNRKIGYLSAGSAERRLAIYLFSIGQREFRLPVSISALSDLLNVGRASLYRAFDRLENDGHLIKNGRSFFLPDPETLLKAYQ